MGGGVILASALCISIHQLPLENCRPAGQPFTNLVWDAQAFLLRKLNPPGVLV